MSSKLSKIIIAIVFFVVFILSLIGIMFLGDFTDNDKPRLGLITLAPNCTDTALALGLGEQIIATDSYSHLPSCYTHFTKLNTQGGLNYEQLQALHPKLVVLPASNLEQAKKLAELKIPYLLLPHLELEDVFRSITLLSESTGQQEKAKKVIKSLRQELTELSSSVTENRPKILFCISRDYDSLLPKQVFIVGKDAYFTPLIQAAGGENCAQDNPLAYPQVNCEQLMTLQPDIIVELCIGFSEEQLPKLRKAWEQLPSLPAVKKQRIYLLTDPAYAIPGPRFPLLLRRLKNIVVGG